MVLALTLFTFYFVIFNFDIYIFHYLRLLLLLLRTIFAPALLTRHTRGIENPPHDMITHTRKIFHPAAADHNNRVLLQIVPLASDVSRHFHTIGQAHPSDLAQGGVRLLGSRRGYLDTHPAFERTVMERIAILDAVDGIRHRRRFRLPSDRLAGTLDKLVDGGHRGRK